MVKLNQFPPAVVVIRVKANGSVILKLRVTPSPNRLYLVELGVCFLNLNEFELDEKLD